MPAGRDFGSIFEAPDLASQVAVLRQLVRGVADGYPAALQLLVALLPAVDGLLADVQVALGGTDGRVHAEAPQAGLPVLRPQDSLRPRAVPPVPAARTAHREEQAGGRRGLPGSLRR